jgi:hypothetical protein
MGVCGRVGWGVVLSVGVCGGMFGEGGRVYRAGGIPNFSSAMKQDSAKFKIIIKHHVECTCNFVSKIQIIIH